MLWNLLSIILDLSRHTHKEHMPRVTINDVEFYELLGPPPSPSTVSKLTAVLFFLSAVLSCGIVYETYVLQMQGTIIKQMMKNKACAVDLPVRKAPPCLLY